MGKAVKQVGKIAGTVSGAMSPLGALTAGVGGKVGEAAGDLVGKLGGGLPTAKAGSGEAAARAIKSDPFDISKQAEEAKKRSDAQFQQAGGRQTAATTESSALRKQLSDIASGQGPSLATAQMKQAQDRNLAQQLAAAASQKGGSAASLQRQLAQQQAIGGQEVAQQAGIARMQEAQAAQQQLGGMLAQEQAASDQAVNNYIQQGFSIDQAQAAAQQDLEKLRQAARAGQAALETKASMANQQSQSQLLGGVLGGAGSIASAFLMSDKNKKKNIKDGKKATSDFLNALASKSYEYKPEAGQAEGKNYGIMAQDLEKSEMGKSLVVDTPEGKQVDVKRGFGAALASMAELNRRTAELERAMKKRKLKSKKKEA